MFGPDTPIGRVQEALDAAAAAPPAEGSDPAGLRTFLFKPGHYAVDLRLGPRTSVAGLGAHPGDVTVDGAVRITGRPSRHAAGGAPADAPRTAGGPTTAPVDGGWRDASPTAPVHRMHVRGRLLLAPGGSGLRGGGRIADAPAGPMITVEPVRVGPAAGAGETAERPARVLPQPPLPARADGPPSRGRPFLYVGEGGHYRVFLPGLRHTAAGAGAGGSVGGTPDSSVPIDRFFVARPEDSARAINKALSQGRHLLLTPGVYDLADTVRVKWSGTVVLGLGHAMLRPRPGVVAMTVADARGVRIAGLLIDGHPADSPVLLEIGARRGGRADPRDPASVQDVCLRVGGGRGTGSALVVNSDGVLLDHVGVWHAGACGPEGGERPAVVVNGDGVRATGLFTAGRGTAGEAWAGEDGRGPAASGVPASR
ncbi:putative secreted protein [Actinacidiphila reveromycinica]|uniref:Putative secreted protein n=1 Tax=Actinacidiphila reveromycinica TaxID=659352 RepID=A0A7U3VSV7_9ACTN|nr:putative secreted protein [Streptomyces sp. SN-593]